MEKENKKGRPVAPCKDCEERRAGCHGSCEKYNTYKQADKEYTDRLKKERDHYLYDKSQWSNEQRKRIMGRIKRKRG